MDIKRCTCVLTKSWSELSNASRGGTGCVVQYGCHCDGVSSAWVQVLYDVCQIFGVLLNSKIVSSTSNWTEIVHVVMACPVDQKDSMEAAMTVSKHALPVPLLAH